MNSFVALDVETANSFRGSLCAIGLVKFENGKITDFFYSHILIINHIFYRLTQNKRK
ncbi:Exonuclease [Streptococcus dysgalactiae subsp. dysgalactiae]|nr:Exonuclease [Streptococcus dysgalactiae subsp. dysgalactiae]